MFAPQARILIVRCHRISFLDPVFAMMLRSRLLGRKGRAVCMAALGLAFGRRTGPCCAGPDSFQVAALWPTGGGMMMGVEVICIKAFVAPHGSPFQIPWGKKKKKKIINNGSALCIATVAVLGGLADAKRGANGGLAALRRAHGPRADVFLQGDALCRR